MTKRTPAEVYQLLTQAGFSSDAAVTMTAIAGGESGWDDTAIGDTALQTTVWGPSYGLFQIRTLKADTGRGTTRDINSLAGDLAAQARAAYAISQGGRDFSPWTVWSSGKYQTYLDQARSAAGVATGVPTQLLGLGITNTGLLDGGKETRTIVITGLLVLGGLGLVVAGLARGLGPKVEAATTKIRKTTADVAKVVV